MKPFQGLAGGSIPPVRKLCFLFYLLKTPYPMLLCKVSLLYCNFDRKYGHSVVDRSVLLFTNFWANNWYCFQAGVL